MVVQFAITLAAWLALLFVSTNLTGFLVRGLVTYPEMDKLEVEGDDVIRGEISRARKAKRTANFVALTLIAAFFLALYYFWNGGVVAAVMLLIMARIPDLVWEMKHGKNALLVELARPIDMARPKFSLLSIVLSWASLPVLWYALYRM